MRAILPRQNFCFAKRYCCQTACVAPTFRPDQPEVKAAASYARRVPKIDRDDKHRIKLERREAVYKLLILTVPVGPRDFHPTAAPSSSAPLPFRLTSCSQPPDSRAATPRNGLRSNRHIKPEGNLPSPRPNLIWEPLSRYAAASCPRDQVRCMSFAQPPECLATAAPAARRPPTPRRRPSRPGSRTTPWWRARWGRRRRGRRCAGWRRHVSC